MDTSETYIKMCEKAPRELWDMVEHSGSYIAWRSFIGIIHPSSDKPKREGLITWIPETLVLRTWCKEDEDILVLKVNCEYAGDNGDSGTPLYRQDQLQEIIKARGEDFFIPLERFYRSWIGYDEPVQTICTEITYEDREKILKDFNSMEQLWLAFVMKGKYNKVWNGEDWIIKVETK